MRNAIEQGSKTVYKLSRLCFKPRNQITKSRQPIIEIGKRIWIPCEWGGDKRVWSLFLPSSSSQTRQQSQQPLQNTRQWRQRLRFARDLYEELKNASTDNTRSLDRGERGPTRIEVLRPPETEHQHQQPAWYSVDIDGSGGIEVPIQ